MLHLFIQSQRLNLKSRQKTLFILIIITLILGGFLRFYNLNWGNGFYFHPDENNMARAVTQLCLKTPGVSQNGSPSVNSTCSLNPHFFAYGQFPLYLAFFSNYLTKTATTILLEAKLPISSLLQPNLPTASSLEPRTASPQEAIFWLRFWSALASTLTIPIAFLIGRKFLTFNVALLTATFVAFTPGLIQSAHFGTTESLLTFFFLLILYLSLKLMTTRVYDRMYYLSLAKLAIVSGLAMATKISAVYFLPTPILAIAINRIEPKLFRILNFSHLNLFRILYLGFRILLFFAITIIIFILSSPYNLLEYKEFISTLLYETRVATGQVQTFYTRQFINTTPLLFQAKHIFPFVLGWPLFILGTFGFVISSVKISYKSFLLLIIAFLTYLLPNSFLFAKWTRFITPTLPFFAIFAAYFIYYILKTFDQNSAHVNWLIFTVIFFTILPGLFFFTIYTRPDTRLSVSRWIYKHIPDGSYILSETGNVVDIPVPVTFSVPRTGSLDVKNKNYNVISFDFYHLDENSQLFDKLLDHLIKADYLLVPSRRIFSNHLPLPNRYPSVANYYKALFSGSLGFKLIHTESPLNCQWSLINNQSCDEAAEETFTVFDHPVIRIYKKTQLFPRSYYENLLLNNPS